MTELINNTSGSEIAIVGMAGRFPDAENIKEFWNNLQNGVESISFFSDQQLEELNVDPGLIKNPDYVKVEGGVLQGKEQFDPAFFGYSPKEAEVMNPQIRVFHECAWHALEDAGYNPESYDGAIGLYAGAGSSTYWETLATLSGKCQDIGYFAAGHLIDKDFLSTQTAYKLNLKGPAFSVHTACSTSLVSIHLACQGLLNGECDMALAGGVKVTPNKKIGYLYQDGMVASPDGHCRAFDEKARGIVDGDGVGVVLLKPLEDALIAGDHIYAVIKGTAINNDGLRKVGYTAPSIEGQAEAINSAHQMAEVEPESIGYVETHGTATPLGDPIEVEALKLAFNSDKQNYCGIGSVKTNIGHLDTAAGIAGLIKTVLALKHKQLPPSLNFKTPNPRIDFKNSPFYVNHKLTPWQSNGYPRRAGVSSFGIGGTNAHVVLEEAPETPLPQEKTSYQREYQLIPLSAKTPSALDKVTENLVQYLKDYTKDKNKDNKNISLADAAYTLATGRKVMQFKRMAICGDMNETIKIFSDPGSRKVQTQASKTDARPVVFMFAGLGSQYVNMGRELYQKEPAFKEQMERCFKIVKSLTGQDIEEILYPADPEVSEEHLSRIRDFETAQLAVFCFEYALAQLIISWGVSPDSMIGYSFGEYVAAAVSGVFSLEQALELVVARGKLVATLPDGSMLSVPMPKKELQPLLNEELSIAIDNGPTCIVAGTGKDIKKLEETLKTKKVMCFPMDSTHAIHTNMMNTILPEFEKKAAAISFDKPRIPYISNLTGKWQTAEEAANPSSWARHMAETVRFDDGLKELLKKDNAVFIEIGPGRDISAMVGRYLENSTDHNLLNLVRPKGQDTSDLYYLLNKIGQLWLFGLQIDWQAFYRNQNRRRLSLPMYPFEKHHYWIEEDVMKYANVQSPVGIADWSYRPLWKRSLPAARNNRNSETEANWLVFVNDVAPGNSLVKKLIENQQAVTIVKVGNEFKQSQHQGAPVFTINPRTASHYETLLDKIHAMGKAPENIIHAWNVNTNVNAEPETPLTGESFDNAQYIGFYSMLYLAKALAKQQDDTHSRIFYLANGTQDVTGKEQLSPEKTPVLGLMKSLPQELSGITCRGVDIQVPESGSDEEASLIDLLIEEFQSHSEDVSIAYRDNQRWVQFFETHHLPAPSTGLTESALKKEGVYLITGGLGEVGFIFAELLVEHARAKLIITDTSPFPPQDEWRNWLDSHDGSDLTVQKIKRLLKLREMGGDISFTRADSANLDQMKEVLESGESTFGKISGALHADYAIEGDSKQLIDQASESDCKLHFRPKVYGTLVLEELLKDRDLDFCWLLSSLSCVLGGLGLGAYAASNTFINLFVKKHNRLNPGAAPWFSLNWDIMEDAQGDAIFQRILHQEGIDQLVLSRDGNLQERIDQWVKLKTLKGGSSEEKEENEVSFKSRPQLMNPYVAPENPREKELTEIWQRLFGFDRIGIDDNFVELGGNSLTTINLTAQIKNKGSHVALTDVMANPTIRQLAQHIDEKKRAEELMAEVYEDRLIGTLDCIEKLNKTNNKAKIFIVHPAHGMLNQYKELGLELGTDFSVYGIQFRGVTPGTKMFENPDEMMETYIRQILTVQPEGPYIIAGFCTGILASYEISRRLEALGHTVKQLIWFDTMPVFGAKLERILKFFEYMPNFSKKIYHYFVKKKFKKEKIKKDRYDEINNVYETVEIPEKPGVNKQIYDYVVFLNHFIIPHEIIKAPILVTIAEDSEHSEYTVEDFNRTTKSNAVIKITPGDHEAIFERPHVETLAKIIRSKVL